MPKAYLSLGSNQEPEKNLAAAVQVLRDTFGQIVLSDWVRTEAVGFDVVRVVHVDVAEEQLDARGVVGAPPLQQLRKIVAVHREDQVASSKVRGADLAAAERAQVIAAR